MSCSTIILNWNGAEMLRTYLPSVVQHTEGEVIVADNGSTDESLEVLRKEFPSVKTIVLDKNYGFAEGYNRAIALLEGERLKVKGESSPEYVVLLNSDVEVTEHWLTPLLDYMQTHPEVAAVQPKIRSWRKRDYFEHAGAAGGYLSALGYPYCRGRKFGRVEQDKGQYDTIANVDWTTGACMCVRTKIYKECGGLDASFFAHMEEIDLCWRMRNKGWKLACVPQSVVYHLGGGSLSYDNPRKTYLNFRNNLLMIYKNSRCKWIVLGIRFFLDYAAAAMFLCTGKTGSAKAVYEARRDYKQMR
ncbi:MAG: glycosyltransferase family 2 protein [Paludibacteraceae bacterium]|nr:glycosyltransferase family 2 protein [Paludibacteraceae bacterium]